MSKTFKKLLLMGVMVIMALGLFACENYAGIQFSDGIQFIGGDLFDFSMEALDEHPTITKLVKSVDELQQLCDESGVIYTGEKYDESYFNEKAIIVYSFTIPRTMMDWEIDSLKVDSERTGDRRSVQSYIDNNMLVNTDTFRTILMVQLAGRSKENVLNAIRILEQRDDIVSAEPNHIFSIHSMEATHPNDENLQYQWVHDNTKTVANIQLEDAWDWFVGKATVLVGVIDSGIDGGNPDLTNIIYWLNRQNLKRNLQKGAV